METRYKPIAHAEERKAHAALVLGIRDLDAGHVAVRIHSKGPQGFRPRAEVIASLLSEIKERAGKPALFDGLQATGLKRRARSHAASAGAPKTMVWTPSSLANE